MTKLPNFNKLQLSGKMK